ncbi:hypothetical protein EYF80_023878 [Liparis tanakae]|uniref:Uncharacterized protein n=1 Tax=Liparis tanakae TaxID=230148 RepID=A0A4Z2HJ91_9TELE|nr:hypothetical protein EYF80_023878 [Liparis tanakae]
MQMWSGEGEVNVALIARLPVITPQQRDPLSCCVTRSQRGILSDGKERTTPRGRCNLNSGNLLGESPTFA